MELDLLQSEDCCLSL